MSSHNLSIGKSVEASTQVTPGKVRARAVVVYYDENCGLCRQLAQLMGKSVSEGAMDFLPSPHPQPPHLVVRVDETDYVGREAWSWLVDHHPLFREWNWLAAKIGLREEALQFVMRGAEVLRKLCPKCRRASTR